jgi:hypothetical protein
MENLSPITFHAPPLDAPPPGAALDGIPLLILAAVALFLLVLAVRVSLKARPKIPPSPLQRPKTKSKCRWARINTAASSSLTKWHCATCGADGFASPKRPPLECKKPLHPAPL